MSRRLAEGLKPITLIFPKIQITRGLNFTFSTDNWGNMPFEAAVKRPVPADLGYDLDWSTPVTILRQQELIRRSVSLAPPRRRRDHKPPPSEGLSL